MKESKLMKLAINSLNLKFDRDEPSSIKELNQLIKKERAQQEELIQVIEQAQEAIELVQKNIQTLSDLKHQYNIEEFRKRNPNIPKESIF